VSRRGFDLAVNESNRHHRNLRSGEVYYRRAMRPPGYTDDSFPHTIESFLDARTLTTGRRQAVPTSIACTARPTTRSHRTLGEYRWFEARGKSVRAANGEAVRMDGSITDITGRKQAEAQLYAEKDRAQVTLQSIAEGVIATDEEGRVETLNPAAQSLTGWSDAEARGRPLQEVFRIVDQADRRVQINPVATLLQEGRTVELRGNTFLVRRDGRNRRRHVDGADPRSRWRDDRRGPRVLRCTDDRRFTEQLSHRRAIRPAREPVRVRASACAGARRRR
jgi:PAS domain S-box-containing protein